MADAGRLLVELGFGDYETRAYLALLRRSPVNGYELAKISDVPRGNIYAVLQKLEERGAVLRMDTLEGSRYAAVPADELLQRLRGQFDRTMAEAGEALSEVAGPAETTQVWNLEGYETLLAHAQALICGAGRELLVAVSPEEARALGTDIEAAAARAIDIRTLCLNGCPQECGACRGHIYRQRMLPEYEARWLVIVADGAELLTGEVHAGTPPPAVQAVRTRQRLLVDLAASYIRNSVALAAVLADAGALTDLRFSPQTQEALRMVGEAGGFEGWLAPLRQVLSTRQARQTESPSA